MSEEADATAQAEAEATPQSRLESAYDTRSKAAVADGGYADDDYDMISDGLPQSKREPEQIPIRPPQNKSPPPVSNVKQNSAAARMEEAEEMEDWEVAPGAIKDGVTNMSEFPSAMAVTSYTKHMHVRLTDYTRYRLFQHLHV
jgi:hypothetical protein